MKPFAFVVLIVIIFIGNLKAQTAKQPSLVIHEATDSTITVMLIAYQDTFTMIDFAADIEISQDSQFMGNSLTTPRYELLGTVDEFQYDFTLAFDTLVAGVWYVRGRVAYSNAGVTWYTLYSDTLSFTVPIDTTDTTVNIISGLMDNPIAVYPNPVSSHLSVAGMNEYYMITLSDQFGRMVFRVMRPAEDQGPFKLPDNLSSGIYSYRIDTANKNAVKSGRLAVIGSQ